ncbi:gfo/Idh/MocA family oxidoreductase [Butyrivibrio sp. CB08]|uniref:Gfo/Idh/MocA family protein n=1 Tax=Butyrivibrio sp. CB08 TaxID=2364879 RepID=UPI000EA83AEC|nr:Gfo/Idh/MocA family oxidoreductase [Butyrivibrio sp. CB08]RKM60425.1 gfo/Idh/MocA family oxidoreductase [Butyrivibrio sp. CB08]
MVRLGIIGTGRIAKRAVKELSFVPEIELVAVFNPNFEHGEAFAKKTETIYGTEAGSIVASPDLGSFAAAIDAAYIATPHGTHHSYAEKMLMAGKHVICEKPLCLKEAGARDLFDLATSKGLVLMEAVKTAYCPGFKKIQEVVESGAIGEVVDVEATFTRLTEPSGREFDPAACGGSFTEFGSYTLLPILRFLGTDYGDVFVQSIMTGSGVDGYSKVTISFGTKEKSSEMSGAGAGPKVYATATARTGLTAKSEGQLVITGTKGYVLVPSPWWLTKYFEVRYEDPDQIERYECEYEGDGLRYEFRELVDRVTKIQAGGGASHLSEGKLFSQKESSEAIARASVFETVLHEIYG